jgi:HemY protein
MKLFRSVLFWLVLVVFGALLAQLLLQDPGYVLVRFRGSDYQTTVAAGLGLLLAFMFGVALLWALLRLPFVAWKRHQDKRGRAQLIDGLHAHQRGEYQRAEQLLTQAAAHEHGGTLARMHAVRAAAARGDTASTSAHLDALGVRDATSQALLRAEHALAGGRPDEALSALDGPRAQPLPPRGLQLRADALAASGRGFEAYGLLGALRQQQALPPPRLDELQLQWAEQSLQQAGNASELADRWDALPQAVQTTASVVAAYARRAATMGWNEAATRSLEQALDRQWDEDLVQLYGQLEVARLDERQAQAERWLQGHPSSPALLLAIARLAKAHGQLPQAERALHRAIAQGAGSPAWEALGEIAVQSGDEPRARLADANALRSQRHETLLDIPGRDLRQQIADTAAIEERDEHGMPRLRG